MHSDKQQHTALLAYGTNIGDKESNIRVAYDKTEETVGHIVHRSSFFHSKPWGFQSDNDFVNTVAMVHTTLTPHQLLHATQQIERSMGRTRKSIGGVYHDRIIDIDLLTYDDISIDDAELTLPHPHMHERDFVYVPMREVLGQG